MRDNREIHLLPNGAEVIFYPDTHQYFLNDIELPSITTMLNDVYGNAYAGVNPDLLQRAAEYGTAVHSELQDWIEVRKINPDAEVVSPYREVQNYFTFVEDIYGVEPLQTEKVVVLYNRSGQPVAAGRFDLLCNIKGELTLADFKTTSMIHRQLVTAQLNLYAKAAAQSGYIDDENVKLGVIHLNGTTSRVVPIPKLGEGFYDKFFN